MAVRGWRDAKWKAADTASSDYGPVGPHDALAAVCRYGAADQIDTARKS